MIRALLLMALLCPATFVAAAGAPETLLQSVQKTQQANTRLNTRRQQRFVANQRKQAALLHQAEARLKPVKARTTHLREQRTRLEADLNKLPARLGKKIGNIQQLVHIVRQTAADLQAEAENSVITAQYPGRIKDLKQLTRSDQIPTAADVRRLWQLLLQQIEASSKVATFTAPVAAPGGNTASRQVTRVGPFAAFAQGNYLLYSSGTGLKQLAGQPEHAVRALAVDLASAGTGLHPVWIAPPDTAVLQHLARRSTLKWRLHHSGAIGYVIVAAGGLVGLVMLCLLLIVVSRGAVGLLEVHRPEALLRYAESRRRFSKSFGVSLLICAAGVWLLHSLFGSLFGAPPAAITKASPAIPIQMVAMPVPPQQTQRQAAQARAGGGGNHSAAPPSPPAVPGLAQPSWDTVPTPEVDVKSTLPDIHFKAGLAGNFSTGAAFGGYAGSGAGGGGGGGTGTGQGSGSGSGTGGQLLIPLSTARPQIPELACKRGIQGYAIAEFNVNPDGRVSDIRIVDAKPRGIFEHAMVESLSHWDYQSWDGTRAYRVNFKFKFRLKDCPLNWSTP